MRSRIVVFVVVVAALVAAFTLSGPAAAHAPCVEAGLPGHSDYARLHIASHTPHGLGVEAHNPGTVHQGYSFCNPSGR